MIISELIQELQKYDSTLEVVVRDFEDGWTKIISEMFSVGTIVHQNEKELEWYYGMYEKGDFQGGIAALFIDYRDGEHGGYDK